MCCLGIKCSGIRRLIKKNAFSPGNVSLCKHFFIYRKDRVDVAPGRLIRYQTGLTRSSSFMQRPDRNKLNLKIDNGDIAEKQKLTIGS